MRKILIRLFRSFDLVLFSEYEIVYRWYEEERNENDMLRKHIEELEQDGDKGRKDTGD